MKRSLVPSWRRRWCVAVVALVVASASSASAQNTFDLSLQRLVTPSATPGGFAEPNTTDAIAYRQFVSELGIALAPHFLSPADTIGYNGFQFDVSYGFTNIDNHACADATITKDNCPWQYAVEGGRDASNNRTTPPAFLHTVTVMARKGIWLPLPSFELGGGATKLMDSDIYAVNVYAKFALHEGFHDWPIPSLAVRGSGTRVMGASQIDLTIAQVDTSISKSFGLGGSANLTPYLGAAATFIIARGQVLDLTPDVDSFKGGPNSADLNNNAVFPSQDTIIRWRFFGGLRLVYSVLVLTVDYTITACGDFTTSGCNDHKGVTIRDNAINQHSLGVSAGFLF